MKCHPGLRALHPDRLCPVCDIAGIPEPEAEAVATIGPDQLAQIKAAGEAATKELAERSLYHFLLRGWHVIEPDVPLETHWHIRSICDHVQWMFEQWAGVVPSKTQNLAINVPPGSLKSRIISVYGPAWAWLHWPRMSFLCLSGTKEVALRDADYVRDIITSDWYRGTFGVEWEIDTAQDARGLFATTAGGLRQSQGITAKVTGVRRDVLILDDPNDAKDISEVKLAQVETAWIAARNRLNDLRVGRRILVQQRIHERDLTGYVIKNELDWEHLVIPLHTPNPQDEDGRTTKCGCGKPTICDTSLGSQDPRKNPGDVLHPERWTPEVIEAEEKALGSLGSAGQLEQRPAPEGGAMFLLKHWRRYDELPREENRQLLTVSPGILSVDCDFKKGGTSRVGMVLGFPKEANLFIEWTFAESLGFTGTVEKIQWAWEHFVDWKTGQRMIGKILIENKANGEAVADYLGAKIPGIVLVQPKGDKMSRANAALPRVEAGNVRLKKNAPWDEEFTSELAQFPNGTYDDLVDAFTQLVADLQADGNWTDLYG